MILRTHITEPYCRKIRPTRSRDEPIWSLPEGLTQVLSEVLIMPNQ